MSNKFPCMLASPNKEIHRIEFPCMAQTKMDGMRAMIVKRRGIITVYSRNGNKMIKLNKHFKPIMTTLGDCVLDGELTVLDEKGNTMDRKTGNGILHKAVESVSTISEAEVSHVRITLWDIVSTDEFDKRIGIFKGMERVRTLQSIPKHELFSVVETHILVSLLEAERLFKKMLAKGEEGIILKNIDHIWEAKRSLDIVKMKEVLETDLEVIGFHEGEGKASGMLGKLTCANKDISIQVDVGTGFSDLMRKTYWALGKTLIGSIVTVKYNGIITRKGSKTKSLFLPVFVEFRPDKDVPD